MDCEVAKTKPIDEIARIKKVDNNFAVYLHLGDDNDLSFMIRVLFHYANLNSKLNENICKILMLLLCNM